MQGGFRNDDDDKETLADKATFWVFIAGSILSLGICLWAAFLKP